MRLLLAICDSHFRAAARTMLAETGLLLDIGESDCLESTLQALRASAYDCALVEFYHRSGEETTLDLLRRMQHEHIPTPIVVLTGSYPTEVAVEAMKAGALDYLLKERITPYVLAQSILRAVQIARERRTTSESAAETNIQRDEAIKARDAALEASRVKAQFLAFTTHELKAPLNAILGFAEMLEEDLTSSGQKGLTADAAKISEAGRHLARLISDLLDLSALEAGKLTLHYNAVRVEETVSKALDLTGDLIRSNGNAVTVEVDEHRDPIQTDEMRLRQILINLLSNAAKFTSQGQITVRAQYLIRAARQWLEVSVGDTGPGLSPDQMARLFEPYQQFHPEKRHGLPGTGLGLTLTRLLCWAMNGEITVESQIGVGSKFTVTLPVEPAPASAR